MYNSWHCRNVFTWKKLSSRNLHYILLHSPLIKWILLNCIYEMSLGICNINIILPGFVNATNLGYRALMPSNKIYWLKYLPRIFLIRISDLSWTCAHSVLRISGMGKSRLLACSPQLKFSTQAGPCLIPPRPNCPMSTVLHNLYHRQMLLRPRLGLVNQLTTS